MKAFAEANDQHLSSFIRSACSEVLRREMGGTTSNIPTQADISKRLEEIQLWKCLLKKSKAMAMFPIEQNAYPSKNFANTSMSRHKK